MAQLSILSHWTTPGVATTLPLLHWWPRPSGASPASDGGYIEEGVLYHTLSRFPICSKLESWSADFFFALHTRLFKIPKCQWSVNWCAIGVFKAQCDYQIVATCNPTSLHRYMLSWFPCLSNLFHKVEENCCLNRENCGLVQSYVTCMTFCILFSKSTTPQHLLIRGPLRKDRCINGSARKK